MSNVTITVTATHDDGSVEGKFLYRGQRPDGSADWAYMRNRHFAPPKFAAPPKRFFKRGAMGDV